MKYLYQIVGVAVIAGLVAYGVSYWSSPKIAYVRIGEVINKYQGMMEAKNAYKQKMSAWQANVDTLELDYQKMVSQYNLDAPKLSASQKREQENTLQNQKGNIQNYISTLEQKAREEDEKMTQGVINQINSSIEAYGMKKGYSYVLGTTNDGNILYGVKSNDITAEVIEYLNNSYKQK